MTIQSHDPETLKAQLELLGEEGWEIEQEGVYPPDLIVIHLKRLMQGWSGWETMTIRSSDPEALKARLELLGEKGWEIELELVEPSENRYRPDVKIVQLKRKYRVVQFKLLYIEAKGVTTIPSRSQLLNAWARSGSPTSLPIESGFPLDPR